MTASNLHKEKQLLLLAFNLWVLGLKKLEYYNEHENLEICFCLKLKDKHLKKTQKELFDIA